MRIAGEKQDSLSKSKPFLAVTDGPYLESCLVQNLELRESEPWYKTPTNVLLFLCKTEEKLEKPVTPWTKLIKHFPI